MKIWRERKFLCSNNYVTVCSYVPNCRVEFIIIWIYKKFIFKRLFTVINCHQVLQMRKSELNGNILTERNTGKSTGKEEKVRKSMFLLLDCILFYLCCFNFCGFSRAEIQGFHGSSPGVVHREGSTQRQRDQRACRHYDRGRPWHLSQCLDVHINSAGFASWSSGESFRRVSLLIFFGQSNAGSTLMANITHLT